MVTVGVDQDRDGDDPGRMAAPDEETARAIVADDPVARGGFARAELRPYQLGFLRGRD
jgi:hypothetical protein